MQLPNPTAPATSRYTPALFPVLVIGAIGVVYGDIGTSPLYAFREALRAASGGEVADTGAVLGVLSLIVWTIIVVVTVKYVLFVLRADNRGEGGILSLMVLARTYCRRGSAIVLALGLTGMALFVGDALITPAISVLSAVEGLQVIAPELDPYVLPVTVVILAGFFFAQRYGTGYVGGVFGPVTLVWFIAIGLSGAVHLANDPGMLAALSPAWIPAVVATSPGIAAATVGAVFLAVTGAEALYADLGHFGRRPIIVAWLAVAFPALLLNYFGQGAWVLSQGGRIGHPFFEMNSGWALVPMVVLATCATVIASQAVISGAFSLASQAVRLNMLPRLSILHTSAVQPGQIYLPRLNMVLAFGVILLVLEFQESGALAAAYGISVSGNMLVTTALLAIVARLVWKWPVGIVAAVMGGFAVIDLAFFASNFGKVWEGGWVSVAVAAGLVTITATWIRGSRLLYEKTRRSKVPLDFLATQLLNKPPQIVSGTAVFLTSDPASAPNSLMHSLKHYKVVHEQNVILTVRTDEKPFVDPADRIKVELLNPMFRRVVLTFGYMEQPNVPKALAAGCPREHWKVDIGSASFFLSRRSLRTAKRSRMPRWQDRLFILLLGTAQDATEYFHIPAGRAVEIGTQVAI
jgi:KUP system potassium uptake protein